MISENIDERIRDFYRFAADNDFAADSLLREDNLDKYVETALDGYSEYPLFFHILGGSYDRKTLGRMMSVDFKLRLLSTAGIASSDNYESVLMIEPPHTGRISLSQYVRCADPSYYPLLFKPAIYRQMTFEKYALEKRKPFLDDSTWYMYIFATRKEFQHRGYGKKLMNLAVSYADKKSCRLCLETNHIDNIALYKHFGFRTVGTSVYKNKLEHYVMLYGG